MKTCAITACMSVLLTATIAAAQPPGLAQGYGPARWGDGLRDVKAGLGPLRQIKEIKAKSGDPILAEFEEAGKPPIEAISYSFARDRLWKVEIRLVPAVDLGTAEAAVKYKYANDAAVAGELKRAGVSVKAQSSGGNVVVIYEVREILDQATMDYRLDKAREIGLLDSL